jgi:hypothetical protein
MPVRSCGGGKFKIGSGRCVFKTKKAALKAQRGFFASRKGRKESRRK